MQAMGNEVYVFDFLRHSEKGLVSSRIQGIKADADRLPERISGIKIRPMMRHDRLQYILGAYHLKRYAESLGADIVLALSGGGYSLQAYLSGFRPFASYVIGSDVLLANGMGKRMNRVVLQAASVVFANGGYLTAKAQEQAPGAALVKLLIGIDLSLFGLNDRNPHPVQMVCTRGFEEIYNNEAIIHALSMLPEDAPEFRFVFVSGGERLDSCIQLAQRVLPPGVRRNVVFLRGTDRNRLLEELHRSHIIVSMARSDGTATSLLEGMACGLYPVLSDIPQNQEWVEPEQGNGILVPVDDHQALATALLSAIEAVKHGKEYMHANRALVEKYADGNRNRQEMMKWLEKAVIREGA